MAWDAGKQQRIQQGIKVSRFYLKHNIFLSFKKNRLLCKFFEKQHTPIRKQESRKENYRVLPPGGGGYSHTLPTDRYVPPNGVVILKLLI